MAIITGVLLILLMNFVRDIERRVFGKALFLKFVLAIVV